MSNCSLTAIPAPIFESTKLKKLDISLNRTISLFTDKLRNLTNLTELTFTASMSDISEIQHLPKLKRLVVHFDACPKNFEDILLNTHWTELCINGDMEDLNIWEKILSRPNLKKLEIDSSQYTYPIHIEDERKKFGINV